MSELEKQAIIDYISALSVEEKELVARCLPVEICFNRIGSYLEDTKKLENGLYRLTNEHVNRRKENGR